MYTLAFTLDGISAQRATALRDSIAATLEADGVTIVERRMARDLATYEVTYVENDEKVVTLVEATDPDAAQAHVASEGRVVTDVRQVDP